MQCVILAGGLGTRMYPITQTIPKALIEINNKPFIHYQLDYLISQGINHIILCVGYLSDMIKNSIDTLSLNIKIDYVDEGSDLKGTAGALKLAYNQNLLDDKFFVIYGDSFLPINFINVYNALNNKAIMTIFKNNNALDKSNVCVKLDHIIYDKNNSEKIFNYIDYGLSVLTKNIVRDYIPQDIKYDLSKVFNQLSENYFLQGYEVFERFYEIGSFSGLQDFKEYLNAKTHNS